MKFKKTIVVVDDEALVRRGISRLLEEYKHISILFDAENGKELLEKLKVRQPQVIIMDVDMPCMDGIEATEQVRKKYPDVKIIILTSGKSADLMYTLMEKGANAFLTKNTDVRIIIKAINEVIEKDFYFDYEISKALATGIVNKSRQKLSDPPVKLSEREIEVAKLICQQHTNREIAEKLCLSPRTIDTYRGSIFEKTGSKNVVGIAVYAFKYNLIDLATI